jgi:hypothetical protein
VGGHRHLAACLLAAAVGVTVAAVQAMVLDGSGCSQISFSCHSACEF